MSSWSCEYTKTYNGHCDQPKERGSDNCYYHTRVVAGLIESDEENALRDMPAIVL